ncbi:ArsR family transcriptional regulator [Halomarina halobia]|uniref:ArsR family transcriptional regulator n=1 Tax=Halomarina halobia TaxID=3033386 RepID=A0ABD6AA07_9EURY|nr:ArsR family transcriptional regulator [Halomarina sp. PSR21]
MGTSGSADDSRGATTWKEHTTAFDRVQSVALTVSEPHTASWVAEEAFVAENTARRHLTRLAELNVLTADTDGDATTYYPDPVYVRTRELRSLVDEHDRDELTSLAVDLKVDIERWQDEYDAVVPDDVRGGVAAGDVSAEEACERRRVVSDWEHARYRLSLIEDALERYAEFTARLAPV